MGKEEIKKKVREYDSKIWKEGIEKKNKLKIYRTFKNKVEEDRIYDNRRSSQILFLARANCMAITNRYRHIEGGKINCDICNKGIED